MIYSHMNDASHSTIEVWHHFLIGILLILQEEWEKELEKLTSRYHQEIRRKRNNFSVTPDEERAMTMRHQKDKDDLEKNMTVKLDR